MKKFLSSAFVLGLWLFVPFTLAAQEGDLFNYENSSKFAQHLFDIRKYEAAAQEYERVLFFRPKDSQIQEKLLSSYFYARQHSLGISRAQNLYPNTALMPGKLAFGYGKLLLMERSYAELDHLLNNNQQIPKGDIQFLQIGQALFTQQWQRAREVHQNSASQTNRLRPYEPILAKTEKLKRKRPLLALGLSAILPGLGRFYTKQWKDGTISFVITGSLGYASYRNFSRNGRGSVLGWVYGGLALGYYAGNLYGSFQSAHRYNQQQSGNIIDETERLLYRYY